MVQRYIPAKIAPWQRKWKTLTYFITAGAAYYFVLWHDWTRINLIPPDHVFARMQQAHRAQLRALLGDRFIHDSQTTHDIISNTTYDTKPGDSKSSTSSGQSSSE